MNVAAMHDKLSVTAAVDIDDEVVAAMRHLVAQLSSSASVPSPQELRNIVKSGCTTLLLARDRAHENGIVGCLALVVFQIPTGVRAWIEDVIVDATARGTGVGEALIREAGQIAEARGARTIELTSRPSREAANRLYRRLGFIPRDTNVYRYTLSESHQAG
jgi:ribosomal protein S18 acetylase RimI-like enzyme